ncbi:acyl CoA binding protein-domain-containing protein [Peziza echinospora]|nr:acyl CoA binding protein-domain-containing protein [Peziza echinospora]
MSDSIDRVFAHALQTVRKIPRAAAAASTSHPSPSTPHGSSAARRPPAEDRLRLYGLYKQSMEGDVLGVMERPTESSLDADKWDAWNAVRGLRKTEAKRRYIECLIETMKKYASDTPEARGLVSELEFVWDQVKWNTHSAKHSNASNHNYTPAFTPPQLPPNPNNNNNNNNATPTATMTTTTATTLVQQYATPPDISSQKKKQQLQMQMHFSPEQQPQATTTTMTTTQSRPVSPANLPVSMYRQEPSRPPDYLGHGDEYTGYQSSGDHEHLINPGRPYYEQPQDRQEWPTLRRMKVGSRGTRSMRSGDEEEEDERSGVRGHRGLDDDDDDEDEDDDEDDEDDDEEEHEFFQQHHHDEEEEEDGEDVGGGGAGDYSSHLILGRDTSSDIGTMRWQLRVERALAKMASEISALRDQLEVRHTPNVLQSPSSWFWSHQHSDTSVSSRDVITGQHSGGGGSKEAAGVLGRRIFGKTAWQMVWTVLRHLMVDAVVVGIVVFWMGKKGDRRAGEVLRWITRLIGNRRRRRGEMGPGIAGES